MSKFLLVVHVLAAILAIGPVAVAASMFPPAARRALGGSPGGTGGDGDPDALPSVRMLHRICRVYAVIGVAVPVFGFATASSMGVLGDTWLVVSIVLTVLAAVVLGVLVLPRQERILELAEAEAAVPVAAPAATGAAAAGPAPRAGADGQRRTTVQLAMSTGVFNLLWAAVTVLMIIRPGSTTGA